MSFRHQPHGTGPRGLSMNGCKDDAGERRPPGTPGTTPQGSPDIDLSRERRDGGIGREAWKHRPSVSGAKDCSCARPMGAGQSSPAMDVQREEESRGLLVQEEAMDSSRLDNQCQSNMSSIDSGLTRKSEWTESGHFKSG